MTCFSKHYEMLFFSWHKNIVFYGFFSKTLKFVDLTVI